MLLYTDSLDLDQLEPIITCCFYTSNTYVAIIILTQVQESNLLLIGTFFMYLHLLDIFPTLIVEGK